MKKNECLSVFHALQSGKNRTSLAVVVGVLAMLLLLLSELLPSGTTQKAAVFTAQTATVSQYQAQLEQQLEELISQLQGAGHTAVMVTLSTGEETVYAVDTQTGDMQQQETHVLYRMALRWLRQPICRRSAGSPCCVKAGETSGLQPVSRSCCIRCWICPQTASVWSSASADPLLLSSTAIAYRTTKGGTVL